MFDELFKALDEFNRKHKPLPEFIVISEKDAAKLEVVESDIVPLTGVDVHIAPGDFEPIEIPRRESVLLSALESR